MAKAWGMDDDTKPDVAADSKAQRKDDPFSYHRNDEPYVMGGDR